jgi:hypothetical protein
MVTDHYSKGSQLRKGNRARKRVRIQRRDRRGSGGEGGGTDNIEGSPPKE